MTSLLSISLNDALNDRVDLILQTADSRLSEMEPLMKKYDSLANEFTDIASTWRKTRAGVALWIITGCIVFQTFVLVFAVINCM